MVAAPGLRLPYAFAAALGRNLDEIEVVASGAREVINVMMRKPPSSVEIDHARALMEQDAAIQGIILRSGRARQVLGDPAITIDVESGVNLVVDADLFSQPGESRPESQTGRDRDGDGGHRARRKGAGYLLVRETEPASGAAASIVKGIDGSASRSHRQSTMPEAAGPPYGGRLHGGQGDRGDQLFDPREVSAASRDPRSAPHRRR